MELDRTVYVVHCIDTEGPLYESIEATFERLQKIFGIDLPPSPETLAKLQTRKLDLGGIAEDVARVVSPQLLDYNDTWEKVDSMLERVGSKEFRNEFPDSEGGGWIYNWHCVDHIGYTKNPRRKEIGFHKIFDHYRDFVAQTQASDGIHWHFHPTHPSLCSHDTATFYLRDTKFFDCLARRLIDRQWFPSVNRAGFHTERPDSHWLLEQWIPFDISNQACSDSAEQSDLAGGRFGDWRRAPNDWIYYHPAHDDYQVPGNCRRYIARCLNVGTRHRLLNETEVRRAFQRARTHGATLMAFTDHDFRDIGPNVATVRGFLQGVSRDFPDVRFQYAEAREAMNRVIFNDYKVPTRNILTTDFKSYEDQRRHVLTVESSEPTFGPQPFLAFRTKSGDYYHDNFDFQEPFRKWTYTFDELSFQLSSLDALAVATNDLKGFPHIAQLFPEKIAK